MYVKCAINFFCIHVFLLRAFSLNSCALRFIFYAILLPIIWTIRWAHAHKTTPFFLLFSLRFAFSRSMVLGIRAHRFLPRAIFHVARANRICSLFSPLVVPFSIRKYRGAAPDDVSDFLYKSSNRVPSASRGIAARSDFISRGTTTIYHCWMHNQSFCDFSKKRSRGWLRKEL